RDFLGGAANGEIASDFKFAGSNLLHFFRFESHGGEVIDVEEMVTAEVLVAARFAGIHGSDVNSDVYGGFGDVLVVQDDRASDFAEGSAHGGNGHMAD